MAYDSCPSCGRHVKQADKICPFCGAMRVAGTARFARSAARPPSSISRAQWLALGSAVVSAVILCACKDGDDAGDEASSRESGPYNKAPAGADSTTDEAESITAATTDGARQYTLDEGGAAEGRDSADAAPMASGSDSAPGGWLTPGEGGEPCGDQQDPAKTCDRATQYCYAHGIDPTVCGSFATTCTPYRGVGDACVGSDFYWDAAACDGGLRRCACLNMTCTEGWCSNDDAGGITLSCGPCYGAPPARRERGTISRKGSGDDGLAESEVDVSAR